MNSDERTVQKEITKGHCIQALVLLHQRVLDEVGVWKWHRFCFHFTDEVGVGAVSRHPEVSRPQHHLVL